MQIVSSLSHNRAELVSLLDVHVACVCVCRSKC